MKNTTNSIADALGGLGLKGLISLGCLSVGIAGVAVGAQSSYKIDKLVAAISKIEAADMNDGVQKTISADIDKLSKQLKDSGIDNIESIIKDLNLINQKIDNLQFIPAISSGYQSDETVSGSKELEKLLQTLSTKIEELTDQVMNNQAELTDINSQTFEILELLKWKKEESNCVEIITNNLIITDDKNTINTANTISGSNSAIEFEYLTHGSVTENSLVEFELENSSVSVDTISGEILESGKVEVAENNQFYWLVEMSEESGMNTNSGFNAFIDVVYDSSSIEFDFNSTVGEISGGLLKIEVTEE